jgi:hypothetical protein
MKVIAQRFKTIAHRSIIDPYFLSSSQNTKPHLLLKNALVLEDPQLLYTHLTACQQSGSLKELSKNELESVLSHLTNSLQAVCSIERKLDLASSVKQLLLERSSNGPESSPPMAEDVLDKEIEPWQCQILRLMSETSLDSALNYYESLKTNKDIPAALRNTLLQIYCSYQQLEAAEKVLEELISANQSPTPQSLQSLIQTAGVLKNTQKMVQLYKQVESGDYGFALTKEIILAAGKGFALQGDVTTASSFVRLLKNKGEAMDASMFEVLILAYAQQQSLGRAVDEYYKMRKMGIQPSLSVLEILITAFARKGDVKQAIQFFYKNYQGKPSLKMELGLVQAHLQAQEFVPAFIRALHTVNSLNFGVEQNLSRWFIPSELLILLASHLKNKHVDYVKDLLQFSYFPEGLIPKFLSELSEVLVFNEKEKDVALALAIAELFSKEKNGVFSHLELPKESEKWIKVIKKE